MIPKGALAALHPGLVRAGSVFRKRLTLPDQAQVNATEATGACCALEAPFHAHQPRTQAKTRGATIDASDSMMNFGVESASFPQVIFSLGTAPEYEP